MRRPSDELKARQAEEAANKRAAGELPVIFKVRMTSGQRAAWKSHAALKKMSMRQHMMALLQADGVEVKE